MNKLKKVWKSKTKILEALWFNHVIFLINPRHWAKREVLKRRDVCKGCPFIDKEGKGENIVIKGKPGCGICGCNIYELTACISCDCSYEESPKWKALNIKNPYKVETDINLMDRRNGEIY